MWLAMQVTAGCDLASSVDSTDSDSYMRQQCSQGYYGPVCSLCLKRTSTQLKPYGRTGTLQCQPCRSAAALPAASAWSGIEMANGKPHMLVTCTPCCCYRCLAQVLGLLLDHTMQAPSALLQPNFQGVNSISAFLGYIQASRLVTTYAICSSLPAFKLLLSWPCMQASRDHCLYIHCQYSAGAVLADVHHPCDPKGE